MAGPASIGISATHAGEATKMSSRRTFARGKRVLGYNSGKVARATSREERPMKRVARKAILAAAATAIACGVALHARADGAAKTLTGVVTDAECGKTHGMMKGMSDAECTRMCVKGGSAYALVVGDQVIELRGHSTELYKYAAQKVTVSGTMRGKDLLVESVKPVK
jgi:hypothetical protein